MQNQCSKFIALSDLLVARGHLNPAWSFYRGLPFNSIELPVVPLPKGESIIVITEIQFRFQG